MDRQNKQVIALAFSDLHLHPWKDFNENQIRTNTQLELIRSLTVKSQSLKVPLLFCGDLVHNPKYITNTLFESLLATMSSSHPFYAISGNHDQGGKNTIEKPVPSYINTLSKKKFLISMDLKKISLENFDLVGIPYINRNKGFKEYVENIKVTRPTILMIHRDLPGAIDTTGFEIGESTDISSLKIFKKFNLVIAGHIHKPQKLSNNVYMLGSPHHQRRSDHGTKMGYWEIYSDFTMKMVHIKAPEYKFYESGESHPNDGNMWLEIKKASKEKNIQYSFNAKLNRNKLAIMYCRANNIEDSAKIRALKSILSDVN